MKKDLISVFLVAVLGGVVAYFVANMFIKGPEVVTYKTVDASSLSADLSKPDKNIFNYLALNPTVEVYVGNQEEGKEEKGTPTEEDNQDDEKEANGPSN